MCQHPRLQPQQTPQGSTPKPGVHRAYLVCLFPLSSCWATEAHFSASCVTKRRWRRRSLSGNFFISDSSIKALKLTRPRNKEKITFSVINIYEVLVWNTEGEVWFLSALIYGYLQCSPSNKFVDFFFGGGPGQGGALRVEGFIKCLELPFNIDKFMKQRTPDLSGQSTWRSSYGWSYTFLLHLSNCSWQGTSSLQTELACTLEQERAETLLSYRKESKWNHWEKRCEGKQWLSR